MDTERPLVRRGAAIAALALAAIVGGCGQSGSDPSASREAAPSEVSLVGAGAPGSVSLPKGDSVPLGLTPAEVEARLGRPAVSLHRKDANYNCMFYGIVGQPPSVQLQYCFRGGKLKLLASYIRN